MRFSYAYILFFLMFFIFIVGCRNEDVLNQDERILIANIEKLIESSETNLSLNADSSIWYAQQAFHLSGDLNDLNTLNSIYIYARALYNKGELYDALKYLIQANELANKLMIREKLADVLNMQGNVYGSLGQYDNAVDHYLDALVFYREINNKQEEAKVYNNLGLIYYRMQQIEKAFDYHTKALNLWDSLNYTNGLGSSFTNIAYIFSSRGQFDSAILYLDNALEIYRETGNLRRESNTYINYGWVYLKKGDPEKALPFFNRSLPMSRAGNFIDIYADGLNKKGWALSELKRYEEAIPILQKGLDIAVDIKDPSLINEINLRLTDLYASMGDYQSALEYQQKWATIKDSIFQDKSAEYIALFEVMYKTEAKEKRITLLEEANKRRALLFQFSIFLAILLLIVIILVYSRYRIRLKFLEQQRIVREKSLKQKELQVALEKSKNQQLLAEKKLKEEENEKLQLDIDHRYSELSSVTLHLYQKNESLSQLLEEVEKVEKSTSPASHQRIRKLKHLIKSNLNLDDDWNNFQMYFNQVHHGFLEKLRENFPDLTNHDLRHCSYIRMNLATKEISRLMNINPTSVQKSRVRLKKKLQLDKEDDLYEFVLRF